MTIFRMRPALVLAIAALALAAGPAAAQPEVPDTGGRVYGLVGGAFGDGRFVATGAGAGLRLTRHLGLDVELTHLSGRNGAGVGAPWFGGVSVVSTMSTAGAVSEDYPPLGAGDDGLFPSIRFEDHGRDVTTFLTKFTVEFPIADGLLFPYLTGGGGVGHVTERHSVVIDPIPWIPWGDNQTTGQAVGADGARDLPGSNRVFRAWPWCSAAGSMYGCGGDSVSASTSAGCGSSATTTSSTRPK